MSTRCMIHFTEGKGKEKRTVANIYRHCDGYPDGSSGVLSDLKKFFKEVEEQCGNDTRFGDPEYLAAKFVVWQAQQNVKRYDGTINPPLNFLSLGIACEDHGDVEFIYDIACDGSDKRPKVTHKAV